MIPYQVIIFQAICRKVRWFPSTIIVNFIENSFKVKILVVGYPLNVPLYVLSNRHR